MMPSSRRSNKSSAGAVDTDHHRFPISEIEVVNHHECDLKKLPIDPHELSPLASMSETSSSTCTDSTSISSRPPKEVPAAAASAETEAKKRQKVSFDRNVVMRYHIHLNDMTPSEIESSFVSHYEFSQTRQECDTIRSLLDEQEALVLHDRDQEGSLSTYDSSTICLDRGIRTTSRCHLVTACRRRAVKEVLKAQEQSWYQFHQNHDERHESDGKRNSNSNADDDLHEYYDISVDLIARAYRRVIRLCRCETTARQIGLQDQLEVCNE